MASRRVLVRRQPTICRQDTGTLPACGLRATRAGARVTLSAAASIAELNVPAIEDHGAVLTGDELTVYFESTRLGDTGCYDTFVATRASVASSFGAATQVAELSTPACEFPTWVSADGCQILLTSNRPGGLGLNDIWLATRPLSPPGDLPLVSRRTRCCAFTAPVAARAGGRWVTSGI